MSSRVASLVVTALLVIVLAPIRFVVAADQLDLVTRLVDVLGGQMRQTTVPGTFVLPGVVYRSAQYWRWDLGLFGRAGKLQRGRVVTSRVCVSLMIR
jgi:hypothetical protein